MNKPVALPVKWGSIPEDLKLIPKWVLWRYVKKTKPNGTHVWAKVPFGIDGKPASSTDPRTWTTYAAASGAYMLYDFDGLGIVLGDDLHGIDLDDCRDPVTGKLTDFAQEVLDKVDGYAEVSPSGTGIKIFSHTNLDSSRTKKEFGVELYRDGRYFTVTGHQLEGHGHLPVSQQDLNWMVKKVWGEGMSAPVASGGSGDGIASLALYRPVLDGWDLDRVIDEVLPHIDPDDGYAEWLSVGAALHHQGEGDPEWLEAWDNWSAGSGKWIEGVCAAKWGSFSTQRSQGRGAVTLATLLKKTKDARQVAIKIDRDAVMLDLTQQVSACTDPKDLQEKIAASAANNGGLSDVEREQLAAAIQVKAKELGVKLTISTVRGWVRSRVGSVGGGGGAGGGGGFVHLNDEGHPLCTIENLRALIEQLGWRVRYNVIKKAIEILISNQSFTRDNRDNAALACMLSECERVRMPTKHVAQYLIKIADENQFNPVTAWIGGKPWDGVSRIEKFYATVVSKSSIKAKLMRKWMIQAVAAAFSPDGIAGQGILTFVGPQNIGKTTWFQRLAPPELDVILTGHTLDLKSKDSIFIVLTYWIVELGELDATFQKSVISALKAFITQLVDKIRRPYAAVESCFGRRTVFGGSVNEPWFLGDKTGSRRILTVPADGFILDGELDMQQVWAEFHSIWTAGEGFNLSMEDVAELAIHNEDFAIIDPIEERIAAGFDWNREGDVQGNEGNDWEWITATEALMRIGVKDPTRAEATSAGFALRKLNGNRARKSNGRHLIAVPAIFVENAG